MNIKLLIKNDSNPCRILEETKMKFITIGGVPATGKTYTSNLLATK